MATNTRKRDPIKHVRDRAKSAYNKQPLCFICGATESLELHHTHGMVNLLNKWAKETGNSLDTDEQVIDIRDEFIETHHKEIYEDVFTLCLKHHRTLHSVYGKSPALSTASKQADWIQRQKDKHNGIITTEPTKLVQQSRTTGFFTGLYTIRPGGLSGEA